MLKKLKNDQDPSPGRRRVRKFRRRVVVILGFLLVVLVAGGGGWYFFLGGQTVFSASPAEPVYVSIKPFVVTMIDDNQNTRFVQLGVDLEVRGKAAAKTVTDVMPAIQDAIRLQILQSKITDITSPEGVDRLRGVLIGRINDTIRTALGSSNDNSKSDPAAPATDLIRNVYFSELVIE